MAGKWDFKYMTPFNHFTLIGKTMPCNQYFDEKTNRFLIKNDKIEFVIRERFGREWKYHRCRADGVTAKYMAKTMFVREPIVAIGYSCSQLVEIRTGDKIKKKNWHFHQVITIKSLIEIFDERDADWLADQIKTNTRVIPWDTNEGETLVED